MKNTLSALTVAVMLTAMLTGCGPVRPAPSRAQVLRVEPGWSMAMVAETLGLPPRQVTTWRGAVWTYRYLDLAGRQGTLTVEFEADRVYLTARM